MPERVSPELNQNINELKTFDLKGLDWQEGMEEQFEPGVDYQEIARQNIDYNGEKIEFIATVKKQPQHTIFRFYVRHENQPLAQAYMELDYLPAQNEIDVGTGIGRTGPRREGKQAENLKGVGLEIYQRLLRFIQDIANQENATVIHEVMRSEDYPESNAGMSQEDWDRTFKEFFQSKHYDEIEPGSWRKEYKSQK
ncbi:MAG: hypothetical protein ABH835_03510 [Patescibacteria group bacterium]